MARLGIAISGGLTPRDVVECVTLAETLGYESAWVAEGHGGDQFAILSACAMATRRIRLGTSISSVFVRSVPTMAMAAAKDRHYQTARTIPLESPLDILPASWHPCGEVITSVHKEVDMTTKVAHVVLAVRDPHAAAAFYTDVLGMQRVWDFDQLDMVFFSFGERDHDIALIKAPEGAPLGNQGFSHVAFEVAGGEDELRRLYRRLLDYGSDVELKADHGLSKSIYFLDPDGNRLEFFYPTMAPAAAMDFMRAGRAGLDPYDLDPAPASA